MKSNQIPPGSFGIPVLGETLSFVFDRDFGKKRYRQYGPIFKTHLLGRPTVVMVGPEALELVLSSQMEMKIIAAHLLRSYDWEILPNHSLDTMGIPNRPKDGLRVRFQPL
ncbi:hypothetical protein [Nostoc sp.]|uniref:hypothetical protein n=1 Tax=Nostoc sp. TaxID=1180 RepID=UPI002FF4D756